MSGWREIPTGVYECDNSCLKILLCWYELNCVFRTDDALSWSLYTSLFPWRITLKFSSGVCYNSIMGEKRCYFASHSLLLCMSCSPDSFLSSRSLCELPGQLFLPQALPVALQSGPGHGAGKTPPLVSQHWPTPPKLVLKAQDEDGFSSGSWGSPGPAVCAGAC